jgi:hypothetical protein
LIAHDRNVEDIFYYLSSSLPYAQFDNTNNFLRVIKVIRVIRVVRIITVGTIL